jgi:cell division protein FtsZ
MADQVLYSGVACITDLMVKEGLINLDFADVRSIMSEMGKAMMGTGEATGERRAVQAAEAAISNPLLDEVSMKGARGLLISITGGNDLTLYEVDEAASRIRQEVDEEANIILGATFDSSLDGVVRVSVVATGIDQATLERADPLPSQRIELTGPSRSMMRTAANAQASLAPPAVPAPQPIVLTPEPPAAPIAAETSAAEIETRPTSGQSFDPDDTPTDALEDEPVVEDFIPPAPEPIIRAPRMPTIEELPAVVQPQLRQARGENLPPPPQPERRRSLLEKLAAFGISRPEDVTPKATAPLNPPRQLTAAVDAAARSLPRGPAPRPAQGQLDPQGRQTPRAVANDEDQLEIPAFLRRSNGA